MTSNLFTRPDLSISSDDLMAEGSIIDPRIYGQYVWWGEIGTESWRTINRWTSGATKVLRDWFVSEQSPVPAWGVLRDCLQVLTNWRAAAEMYGTNLEKIPPIELKVPPFSTDWSDQDHDSYPDGATLWLEPNELGGWTLLHPSEH